MSSHVGRQISPPWRGAPATLRWRVRGGVKSDLLGSSLLLVAWVLLWAFFVIAVMVPAARLHPAPRTAPRAAEVELAAGGCATSHG